MRKIASKLHLILGLLTGLIVMITCFTGAVLVFEKEINEFLYTQRYKVSDSGERASLSKMIDNLKKEETNAKITSITLNKDPQRTVSINYNKKGTSAFFNPYTGELIEKYSYQNTFFYSMFSLHRWLLSGDIGKLIVGVSTTLFLFIIISGLITWWRPNKKFMQQILKMNFKSSFTRLNYDFHLVFGFYMSIFLFIFAFTGLAWSFEWFNKGIYIVTNSKMEQIKAPNSIISKKNNNEEINIDYIIKEAMKRIPEAKSYTISLPKDEKGSFQVSTITDKSLHETAFDYHYFDQYTGELISTLFFSERNLGQKVRATFKPVHISSIFNLPSKIIGFIACIVGTLLPIGGFIIFYKKNRKTRNRAKNNTNLDLSLQKK